jgi:enoyl-CoA hydratase/carnithine racemase
MAADLAAALETAHEARAIVLAGEGADFCIGRDMPPPAPGSGATPASVMRDDAQPMLDLLAAFRRRTQPVIAAVQGRAWGIGTGSRRCLGGCDAGSGRWCAAPSGGRRDVRPRGRRR